ncbi:MAG: DUF7033 domain-containing protein [bacterium]
MITVFCTKGFIPEKKYVFDFIFNEVFEKNYCLKILDNSNHYIIKLDNDNIIRILDSFWIKQKNENYIKKNNLPQNIIITQSEFSSEHDILSLYGSPKIIKSNKEISCELDIIASIFFMLSRWEECLNSFNRDNYNRFSISHSSAFKNNFITRPLVNEYIELIKNFLAYLNYNIEYKDKYQIIPTHDIDDIYKFKSKRLTLKDISYNLIKQQKYNIGLKKIYDITLNNFHLKRDPFDTFNYLMQLSEKYKVKSRFYLRLQKFRNQKHLFNIQEKIIDSIKKSNHIIGFHPGFNTYSNEKIWLKEKNLIESKYKIKMEEGRQHYLQFKNPITWRIWDNNNMKIDSTLCYPEHEGFRCGTASEFHVFDVYKRKKLNLIERPTIIMDRTLTSYRKIDETSMLQIINYYKNICKKYKMPLTILFHNSSFCYELKKLRNIYPKFF